LWSCARIAWRIQLLILRELCKMLAQVRVQAVVQPCRMALNRGSVVMPARPLRPHSARSRRSLVVVNVKTESQGLPVGFEAPEFEVATAWDAR
jgi:hypothetical protein